MGANQTSFKKGHDPRRFTNENNGLVNYHQELTKLLNARSMEAITFMYDTLNNEKASLVLRMRAAEQILDRAHGKPVDRAVITTVDSGTNQDAKTLDDATLLLLIKQLDSKVIEGEVE
jgi:hypothetical protein